MLYSPASCKVAAYGLHDVAQQALWDSNHLDLLRLGEPVQQDKPQTPTSQGCKHLSVMTPHCSLEFLSLDFLDFLRLQLSWSFS